MEQNKNNKTNYSAYFLITLIVVFLISMLPAGGYIESPGNASDVSKLVTIDGKHDKQKGSFKLTTVYMSKANLIQRVQSHFNPHDTFQPNEVIEGEDGNNQEFNKVNQFMMTNSIANAQIVAYHAADKEIEVNYNGIYIRDISKESKFKDDLKVGDVIVDVDNQNFDSSRAVVDYLASKEAGDQISIKYKRGNKEKTISGETITIPNSKSEEFPNGRVGIGIGIIDDISVKTNPETKVDTEGYAGPSAGLMFSLQIYDQLTNSNLTQGQAIAGTGSIDQEGNVFEIGGIDKKIIAANNAGVKIFFAPYVEPTKDYQDTNYNVAVKTAKEYAKDIKIIPVRTFQDAKNYLESGEIINIK